MGVWSETIEAALFADTEREALDVRDKIKAHEEEAHIVPVCMDDLGPETMISLEESAQYYRDGLLPLPRAIREALERGEL